MHILCRGVQRSDSTTRGVSGNGTVQAVTVGFSMRSLQSIQGKHQYLWRAVDQDGDRLDILVQSRKNKHAAKRFFRKLLKGQERPPIEITTDKLRSYAAAKREMMPSVDHCQDKYANNRAEVSHEHTREQERQMGGLTSSGQAQRFLSVHGQVHNLFRVGRHLLRATNYRLLRGRAFATWQGVTCAK